MFALGFTNYWDTYFAGRVAPLGLVPADVVDVLFYNFAPGDSGDDSGFRAVAGGLSE